MPRQQNRIYIVICEGKSEEAYIQNLNRLLRERDSQIVLIAKSADTGHFAKVVKTLKREQKNNPRQHVMVWLDWDIYQRNENNNRTLYDTKDRTLPDFFFSRQNFEDFLATHLPWAQLNQWLTICQQHHHFDSPLPAEAYGHLFREHLFPTYRKGELPFPELTEDLLQQMLINQQDGLMPLHCDFADFVRHLL